MLEQEKVHSLEPPGGRFGHTLHTIGQRVLLLGGWEKDKLAHKDKSFILDLEQELEKQRRLEEEFQAKLQRDQLLKESQDITLNLISSHEVISFIYIFY